MAAHKKPEKTFDVPPTGDRNADPITDEPGAHPVETGLGAAIGGLATGAAVGSVTGPLGTAIGAAIGAVAGGYAGKGVGEMIDPTCEDAWIRNSFPSRPYADEPYEEFKPAYDYAREREPSHQGRSFDEVERDLQVGWDELKDDARMDWDRAKHAVKDVFDYRSAHRYADQARDRHQAQPFTEVEPELRKEWDGARQGSRLTWDEAREAVRHAYDRSGRTLREEQVKSTRPGAGVSVAVPIKDEEIAVDRGSACDRVVPGSAGEEIRVPVNRAELETDPDASHKAADQAAGETRSPRRR